LATPLQSQYIDKHFLGGRMSGRRVNDEMTKFPEVAFPGTTVKHALEAMEKWGIRHLPVIEKGKVVGVVSQRDLMLHLDTSETKILRDLMTTEIYTVNPNQYLHEVVFEMAQRKFGSAVVVNEQKEIVGIFTTTDALYLLSKLLMSDKSSKVRMAQINLCSPEYMF
jgi:acetoin utilization protein AcuB